MNCEAVILAGGLGTRLRDVTGDLPKPMAVIAGRPFLEWQLDYLGNQGVQRVVLAVGYRAEVIERHFGPSWHGLDIAYSRERQPLGTGGAILAALQRVSTDRALVLNGDSLVELNFSAFIAASLEQRAIRMAVVRVPEQSRYGSVTFNPSTHRVISVAEKAPSGPGFINAGVYCLPRNLFDQIRNLSRFSFEESVLRDRIVGADLFAFPTSGTFIDIGIPEDFVKAQSLIPDLVAATALNSRFAG